MARKAPASKKDSGWKWRSHNGHGNFCSVCGEAVQDSALVFSRFRTEYSGVTSGLSYQVVDVIHRACVIEAANTAPFVAEEKLEQYHAIRQRMMEGILI